MANYSILCTVNAYVTGYMGVLGYLDGWFTYGPTVRIYVYNITNSAVTCSASTYAHVITFFKK